jgi:hypothetical protein
MYLRCHVLLLGLAVAVFTANLSLSSDAAKPESKRVPTLLKTKFDPDAERVGLFAGMESGSLESWLIPQDEKFGYVFVENKAHKPLTVEIPRSVVAVQNLKQFNLGNNKNGIFGNNGNIFGGGQNQNQLGQGGGGMQSVGGGLQQGGNNVGNNQFPLFNNNRPGFNNNNNGFFFSIPPQSRVRLDFHSVCLNHGLQTPSQRNRYFLVETDKYTKDEKLKELLALVGTGKIDPDVSQAVAWHLTDGMTYKQLAAKQQYHLGGYATSYFQTAELQQAVKLLDFVEQRLEEQKKAETSESAVADSGYESSQN